MKIISDLVLSLYFFLCKLLYGSYSKNKKKHSLFTFCAAYIKANLLFPEATLNENSKLAKLVLLDLLGMKSPETESRDEKKKRDGLCKNLYSDGSVTDALANYFLLDSFYCSIGNKDGHNEVLKEKEYEALAKAKSYKDADSINKPKGDITALG